MIEILRRYVVPTVVSDPYDDSTPGSAKQLNVTPPPLEPWTQIWLAVGVETNIRECMCIQDGVTPHLLAPST